MGPYACWNNGYPVPHQTGQGYPAREGVYIWNNNTGLLFRPTNMCQMNVGTATLSQITFNLFVTISRAQRVVTQNLLIHIRYVAAIQRQRQFLPPLLALHQLQRLLQHLLRLQRQHLSRRPRPRPRERQPRHRLLRQVRQRQPLLRQRLLQPLPQHQLHLLRLIWWRRMDSMRGAGRQ